MKNEFTDNVLALIKKDFGAGLAVSGADFLDRKVRTIPIAPALNLITGGIPEGSWVNLSGPEKSGKTVTALHFAAKCQQEKYGKKHVYYLNVEGRLKKMNLSSSGINMEQITIIESTEDKILSAQDYLNIAELILRNQKECLMIVDSYSMLCHEKEQQEGVGVSTRGGGALLLSQFCRQMAAVVPVRRHIVLGIVQLMSNTSGWGASIQEKGGNSIKYQVDVKGRIRKVEEWVEEGKRIGNILTWEIECSALGLPPHQECQSYIRYGKGIDEFKESIVLGTDLGLIEKAGSYYTCSFMQNHLTTLGVDEWTEDVIKRCKVQGEEKLYQLLKSNPSWVGLLEKEVSTMLGIK